MGHTFGIELRHFALNYVITRSIPSLFYKDQATSKQNLPHTFTKAPYGHTFCMGLRHCIKDTMSLPNEDSIFLCEQGSGGGDRIF